MLKTSSLFSISVSSCTLSILNIIQSFVTKLLLLYNLTVKWWEDWRDCRDLALTLRNKILASWEHNIWLFSNIVRHKTSHWGALPITECGGKALRAGRALAVGLVCFSVSRWRCSCRPWGWGIFVRVVAHWKVS